MKLIRTILLVLTALAIIKVCTAKAAQPGNLFRSGEFDISIGGTASIGTAQREAEAVVIGTQFGADYFVTKNLGLGARAELNDFGHSVIDRANGRVTLRAPLWDRVAPYAYAEGGYQFERERIFAGAGGGAELRFTKSVGAYAELGLETDTRGAGTGRAAAGIKLPF